jgi:monoamine oxidase
MSILQNKSQNPKIVIIGAGISGLKLAETLSNNNLDVTILEYSDYIGGRVKSLNFCNRTFQEGANWIHGLVHEKS